MALPKIDYTDISYLKSGDARQQELHRVLIELGILEILAEFDPIVVGTIPIGIALPRSDVDILFYTDQPDRFLRLCDQYFVH